MSFFQQNQFNASAVDTTDNFQPLPEGEYRMLVASAEEKRTKDGTGLGLNVKYEVVEGQHKGRSVFHWINLQNKSKVAEEIGHKELARLCLACKIETPRAPSDFCGKLIKVSLKVEEYNGEKKNAVKAIIIPSATTIPQVAQPTQQPAQASDDAPAWGN
jgi:hypothetical protein